MGRAARAGVVFRNAEAIQQLQDVDTLIVDKTGTLTEGRPQVARLMPAPDVSDAQLLGLAAALETGSEHPLAAAILAAARARNAVVPPATRFAARPGLGVIGTVDGM